MNPFRNIRIYPDHGSRSAAITWQLEEGTEDGDVYIAYSDSGVKGSWDLRNPGAPVASAVGMFQDESLVINAPDIDGYYRLLLTNSTDDGEHFSLPIQIAGDITPKEYGMARAIIHREFTMMRVTDGYPVWHCIPKAHGELSDTTDPDTGRQMGIECDDGDSYGLPYKGGFYPPILTWMRAVNIKTSKKDDQAELSPAATEVIQARLMAFPEPRREHMIVDPASGRRYLVGDDPQAAAIRGVLPVAYDAQLVFLARRDPRYKFPVPELDTKAYRKIPYWSPTPS